MEFHFTYRRPLWQYVVMGVALTIALALFVTAGIISPPGRIVFLRFNFWASVVAVTAVTIALSWMRDWVGNLRWFVLLYFFALLALLQAVV